MQEKSGERNHGKAGIGDLFSSVVGLGEATTKFTINQMQNAVAMLTHPTEAIDRVKDSIDDFSKAMNGTVSGAGSHGSESMEESMNEATEPSRAADTLSGRKQ
jgi:hypothetical protein